MVCYEQIRSFLEEKGQAHILRFWDELTEAQRENLFAEIRKIDFEPIAKAFDKPAETDDAISPMPAHSVEELAANKEVYEAKGLAALAEGKMAAVLLAGGMGSRLGFDHAKGCYNLSATGELYIFQVLVQNAMDNARKAGRFFPIYVMTSDLNHEETVAFFKEHANFGYPEDMVYFFRQDMAPFLDGDGKILMSAKDSICFAPNGNGGWFSSLKRNGMLADMKKQGIEWLNVFSVDNVLQQIGDPVFLGAVLAEGTMCGAKVIAKSTPEERIGVICFRGTRPSVVEYTELSDEMRYAKNEAGEYLYHYGVTLNYLFNIEATEARAQGSMPIHLAHKKIACLDEAGNLIVPEAPNGYKMETFIFDILEFYPAITACAVVREDEFAPVKNAEGSDSPDTARALLLPRRPEWKDLIG